MIILFNGPPRSGKDFSCEILKENFDLEHVSFKDPLFEETADHFNVSLEWFLKDYNQNKEQSFSELDNKTKRQALIYVAENIYKAKYGPDYYGRALAKRIDVSKNYVISDSGFPDELYPILDLNTDIILIQLVREGCTFAGDSRSYIGQKIDRYFIISRQSEMENPIDLLHCDNVYVYRIYNNGTKEDLESVLLEIYKHYTILKND